MAIGGVDDPAVAAPKLVANRLCAGFRVRHLSPSTDEVLVG
jgi:hypothetical protein